MKFLIAIFALCLSSRTAAQVTCTQGYYDAGAVGCRKCPAGTFQPNEGATGCKPCPDGLVSMVEGSIECEPCGDNEEPSQFKNSCECVKGAAIVRRTGACKLCKPGEYMHTNPNRPGRRRCLPCAAHEFQPKAGQTSCLQCPGRRASNKDRTKCPECKEGEQVLDGVCGKCPPGQAVRYPATYCSVCGRDTFKAAEGNGPCLPCHRNSFSMEGDTKCITCPEGQALMRNGRCGSCPPGKYYDSFSRRCIKCRRGQFQPYENIREICFKCSEDKNSERGATECTKCAFGEVLMKDGTCGICLPGWGYDAFALKCKKCGINEYSKGKGVDQICSSCFDFSYALRGASECFRCPAGQALVVNKNRGGCKACLPGTYYERHVAECRECGENNVSPGGNENFCTYCEGGTVPNADRSVCVY